MKKSSSKPHNSVKINLEKDKRVKKLIKDIQKRLSKEKIFTFKKEPTVYYSTQKDLFLLKICDEGNKIFSINKEKTSTAIKNNVLNLYLRKEILVDQLWFESVYPSHEFINSVIKHRDKSIFIAGAYTQNLLRIERLEKDKHYFAVIVLIVSAFENAIKDLFFENSELWFYTIHDRGDLDLMKMFGVEGKKKDHRITIKMGDIVYSFSDENYEKYKSFFEIKNKEQIYEICKKIGIFNEYFEKLSSHNFNEIGINEILKNLLKDKYRGTALNFQKINGVGGVRWAMKYFFSINMAIMENELKCLEDIFLLRHKVIHGFVSDSQIDYTTVKKAKESLKKVLLFLDHEINAWWSVVP